MLITLLFIFALPIQAKVYKTAELQSGFDSRSIERYRGQIDAIVDYSSEGESGVLGKLATIAQEAERKGLLKRNPNFFIDLKRVYAWYFLLVEHTAAVTIAHQSEKEERFLGKRLTRAIKRAYYFFVEQFTRADDTDQLMNALLNAARVHLNNDTATFKELYEKLRSIASEVKPWTHEEFDFFLQQHKFFTTLYRLITEQLVAFKIKKKEPSDTELTKAFLPLIQKAEAESKTVLDTVIFKQHIDERQAYAVIATEKESSEGVSPKPELLPQVAITPATTTTPSAEILPAAVQAKSEVTKDDIIAKPLDTDDEGEDLLQAYASRKGQQTSGWGKAAIAGVVGAAAVGATAYLVSSSKKKKSVKKRAKTVTSSVLQSLKVTDLPDLPAGIVGVEAQSHVHFAEEYKRLQQSLEKEIKLLAKNKDTAMKRLQS